MVASMCQSVSYDYLIEPPLGQVFKNRFTQRRPSQNRANPGLNAPIPLGLKKAPRPAPCHRVFCPNPPQGKAITAAKILKKRKTTKNSLFFFGQKRQKSANGSARLW
jgi:hypothetical protein